MKDIKFLKENGVDVDKAIELFGDIEIYNETMNDFISGIDEKLSRLKTTFDNKDLPNYAIFAHSAKSDARYLGFSGVAEVALKHEMAGKEGNQKFIEEDYNNLTISINNMIDVVKRYLTENPDNIEYESADNLQKTIVVVDDSQLITNLIDKTLKENYKVIIFNKGTDVKNYLLDNKANISVLLLDLNMPEVNGFDILEYMKQNNLFEHIKVSIITGDESQATIAQAFSYPIIDMLNKPFSVTDLENVVQKTIDR